MTCSATVALDDIERRRYHRSMKIRVLYFAVFRDRIGRSDDAVTLVEGGRVKDAIAALAARYPVIDQLRGKFRIAVNQEFADEDHALADDDELALIPPVAGGSDEPGLDVAERHVR